MSEARKRWDVEHRRYDIPHLRLRQVAALVTAAAPRRVLDIGCATGHLRKLLGGVEYVGCDFAEPAGSPGFEFHRCDLNQGQLPAQLRDFDVVVCSGILEYVHSLPPVLAQVARCLRGSGTFVCTYFNDGHLSRALPRMVHIAPQRHPDWSPLLSLEELCGLLEASGLRVRNTYASTLGIGRADGVTATVGKTRAPTPVGRWSRLLAHQFLIESTRDS